MQIRMKGEKAGIPYCTPTMRVAIAAMSSMTKSCLLCFHRYFMPSVSTRFITALITIPLQKTANQKMRKSKEKEERKRNLSTACGK